MFNKLVKIFPLLLYLLKKALIYNEQNTKEKKNDVQNP